MPHWDGLNPCWLCCCNKSDKPYTDVSRHAVWVPTCPDLSEAPSPHPLWRVLGISRYTCIGDLMHSGSLGSNLYCLGSVLCTMFQELHGNQINRHGQLTAQLIVSCSALGLPKPGRFKMWQYKPDKPFQLPVLNGVKVKYSHVFLEVVAHMSRSTTFHNESVICETRVLACEHLLHFLKLFVGQQHIHGFFKKEPFGKHVFVHV